MKNPFEQLCDIVYGENYTEHITRKSPWPQPVNKEKCWFCEVNDPVCRISIGMIEDYPCCKECLDDEIDTLLNHKNDYGTLSIKKYEAD